MPALDNDKHLLGRGMVQAHFFGERRILPAAFPATVWKLNSISRVNSRCNLWWMEPDRITIHFNHTLRHQRILAKYYDWTLL